MHSYDFYTSQPLFHSHLIKSSVCSGLLVCTFWFSTGGPLWWRERNWEFVIEHKRWCSSRRCVLIQGEEHTLVCTREFTQVQLWTSHRDTAGHRSERLPPQTRERERLLPPQGACALPLRGNRELFSEDTMMVGSETGNVFLISWQMFSVRWDFLNSRSVIKKKKADDCFRLCGV